MTDISRIPEIQDWIDIVENDTYKCSKDQKLLVKHVKKCFKNEKIHVNTEQLSKYMHLAKEYVPFDLFPWQKFIIALHDCTYWDDSGMPRWPDLFAMLGRGAGKDGTIAVEAFCLTSPYNGIREYDVDICANNEEQAMRPVQDLTGFFEEPKILRKIKKFYDWTKEKITCSKTKSTVKGRTNSPKGKDGLRSGIVIFNEIHQYENYDNINVFTTGLGKKEHPRRSYYTTNGDVREGPLDDLLEDAEGILQGEEDDNGLLPFICRLDSKKEVDDEANWTKANPSLPYLPNLLAETRKEYREWKKNPERLPAFMSKRMNLTAGAKEAAVTSWENIKATNKELPELKGWSCTVGIDYMKTSDFAAVNFHFKDGDKRYDINHAWICSASKDIPRIKAPWREWVKKGQLEYSIVADIQGTTNEQEKMNMAALAFGTMAEDGGTKFIEALSSTGSAFDDTKGKMQGLMSVKYDDIESSISGLGRAIRQNVLQPVVDEVTPKVTESIQEITGKIPEAVQKVQEMLPVLGGVAIAVGVVTAALKLQAAVTAVKTAMDAAQVTTLSGLIAAEWAQATAAAAAFAPYLLIVAAIAAVVAAIVLLVKNWDAVKEKCIEVAQIIGEKWHEISTAIRTAISTAFNTASTVVSTVTAAIQAAISTAFNTASTVVSTVTSAIRTAVSTAFNAMKTAVTTAVNATKTAVTTVWNGIKSTVSTVVNAVRTTVTTVWNGIRSVTSSVWNGIKTAVTTPINAAKSAVSTTVNGIRSTMTSVFGGIRSTVSSIFSGIQSAITSPIQTAKNTLANLVSGIGGLFSGLHISLPHINLPHFRISGGTPPYGIAGKGTAPSIGIDWYAQGAVLKKATSFGINTVTGNRMVGGEAGYEAVAPIDVLQGYVQAAVESVVGNSALDYDLLADKIANACARTNTTLELDGRQLGRVVRGYV